MGAYLEVWGVMGRQVSVLECDNVLIGRADINDITLREDGTASRVHAGVTRYPNGWCLRDLGSANGTYVNGERVVGERWLRSGDEIIIGSSRLVFRGDPVADGQATLTAEPPPALTRREHDVLIALCRPLVAGDVFAQPAGVSDLAAGLVVSEAAIKSHLINLYTKFGIHDSSRPRRVQLAQEALRRRAVTLSELSDVHTGEQLQAG